MKNSAESLVLEIADKLADEMGVYVVDVSIRKEKEDKILSIYIDKEGGVGIDDCEAFSRAIDPILDEEDPIDGAYNLEVSSPGADRKLVTEREFGYYLGREVDVKLYKAIDGEKEFSGILDSYSDGIAFIKTDDGIKEVNKKEAVYIRLHFEF